MFVKFKGALAEQYVCQELIYRYNAELYFYSESSSKLQVDFLIQLKNEPIPIEVKSGNVVQAKSLKEYIKESFSEYLNQYQ